MFRELAFLCLAGFASANFVDHGFSTTASPIEVSSPEYYYDNFAGFEYVQAEPEVFDLRQGYTGYAVQDPVVGSRAAFVKPAAVVKTVAVPAPQKVTVESHQQVTAHPPTAPQPVPVAVQPVQTVSANPGFRYVAVPAGYSQQPLQVAPQPIAHQPAVQYVLSPIPRAKVVDTVAAGPVLAKKVTVETHQTVTAHPPTAPYVPAPASAPVLTYPANYQVKSVVNRPAVQRIVAPVTISSKYIQGSVTAHPPSVAYVTTPRPVALIKPTFVKPIPAAKKVTVESHKSVTAHPPTPIKVPVYLQVTPPPIQYVSSTTYAPIPAQQVETVKSNPIPVPVYFSAEEAPQPQIVPAVVSYQAPASQPIPVPVAYPKSEAYVNYAQKVSPVVYTKTITENSQATVNLVPNQVQPNYEYRKAVAYSPASEVSRVSFNGLGVSYGW